MLEKVESHVKQSEDHPSCISRLVRLQFVYGAEQSLELFVKEFEKMNLPEYLLNNVEKYYYLTRYFDIFHLKPAKFACTFCSVSVLS